MRVPGFRSGKVPPEVVLRQVGREAVLDEAVRRGLPGWYEEALADAGHPDRRRPAGGPRRPAREGRAARVHDRGRRGAAGQARRLQGRRGRPPRARRSTTEEVQAELERLRESLASLETVERAAGEGDFVVMDFVGSVDGEPFEGGEGRGQLRGARLGPADPGLRGAARRAPRPATSARSRSPSPTTTPPSTSPARTPRSPWRSRRSRRSACPSWTTTSRSRRAASTRSTSCAPRSSRASREAEERAIEAEFREAAVDAVVGAGAGRGAAGARALEGARDVAPHRAPARRAGHQPASSTSR